MTMLAPGAMAVAAGVIGSVAATAVAERIVGGEDDEGANLAAATAAEAGRSGLVANGRLVARRTHRRRRGAAGCVERQVPAGGCGAPPAGLPHRARRAGGAALLPGPDRTHQADQEPRGTFSRQCRRPGGNAGVCPLAGSGPPDPGPGQHDNEPPPRPGRDDHQQFLSASFASVRHDFLELPLAIRDLHRNLGSFGSGRRR